MKFQGKIFRINLCRCDWLSSDSDLFLFRSSVNDNAGLALGELAWVDDGVVKPINDSLSPWFEFPVDIIRSDLIHKTHTLSFSLPLRNAYKWFIVIVDELISIWLEFKLLLVPFDSDDEWDCVGTAMTGAKMFVKSSMSISSYINSFSLKSDSWFDST